MAKGLMNTVILQCNERDEPDVRSWILQVQGELKEGESFQSWSCGRVRKIQVGDRVFLQRTGDPPRGYFASGYAIDALQEEQLRLQDSAYQDLSEAYPNSFYNDSFRICFEIDSIVDFDSPLEIDYLKSLPQFDGCNFIRYGGGTSFDADYTQFLEREWKKHTQKLSKQGLAVRFGDISEKAREAVIQARRGQRLFRRQVIAYWSTCAVTGCAEHSLLRASHIKPWAKCNLEEALDPFNGLLLSPSLDAAFDSGYISFNNSGEVLISDCLTQSDAQILGISPSLYLSKIHPKHQQYLAYHRQNIFKG